MYADYAYYVADYCGTLIKTQDEWLSAVREATAIINRATYDRLRRGAEADDAVKMAECALADVAARRQAYQTAIAARSPGVTSFNTDGYSESYADAASMAAQYEDELAAALELYLPRTHPLRYAGLYDNERWEPCFAATNQ